ncbi:MAG: thioredoxin domain-containing protein [Planctomycetaceae bacterium]|nr:thioredoxin [Planctomycetaceae bacterium]
MVRHAGVAVLMAAACCGGCAGEKLQSLQNEDQFQSKVLDADKPVLVNFYKTLCPTCILLEPELDKLSDQYKGRVLFFKFERVPSEKVREQYDAQLFPTAILFVNGQDVKHFVMHYNMEDYHKELTALVGPPTGATTTQPASQPASGPASAPAK